MQHNLLQIKRLFENLQLCLFDFLTKSVLIQCHRQWTAIELIQLNNYDKQTLSTALFTICSLHAEIPLLKSKANTD